MSARREFKTALHFFLLSISLEVVLMEDFKIGETRDVNVKYGSRTKATLVGPDGDPVKLIWGHGLGSKDPELRNRFNDRTSNITFSSMAGAKARCVCYDARGHGESHGWESSAQKDRLQFSWPHLSGDMLTVSENYSSHPLVLGGSSMGSATALYAALQHPESVAGLLLVRLPTAWTERINRKPQLMQAARNLQESKPDGLYHNVLLGSAVSDLPPVFTLKQALNIPVLILAVEGDPTHPVTTAKALSQISSDTELVVSGSYEEAIVAWPAVIKNFLDRI